VWQAITALKDSIREKDGLFPDRSKTTFECLKVSPIGLLFQPIGIKKTHAINMMALR
jgi:hypothetical protein